MVGWHLRLNGHESEHALGDGRQGSLACCSPWGRKELDTTERLNSNKKSDEKKKKFWTPVIYFMILEFAIIYVFCPWKSISIFTCRFSNCTPKLCCNYIPMVYIFIQKYLLSALCNVPVFMVCNDYVLVNKTKLITALLEFMVIEEERDH